MTEQGNRPAGNTPEITPRTRAKARHILDHYYIGPARDARVLEIWGYTPEMSYAPATVSRFMFPQQRLNGPSRSVVTVWIMNPSCPKAG